MTEAAGRRTGERALVAAVALAAVALSTLALASPAGATLPGRSGRIAYFTVPAGPGRGLTLWTVDPRAARPVPKLGNRDIDSFAFSPGGALAAVGNEESGLGIADVMQATRVGPLRVRRLTSTDDCTLDDVPRWSRSGRELIFERSLYGGADCLDGKSIAVFRIAVGERRPRQIGLSYPLSERLVVDSLYPDWSSSGEIVFQRLTPATGSRASLFSMSSSGTRRRRLTSGHDDESPSWSPNGRQIAFVRYSKGSCGRIYIMRRDGSQLRKLNTPKCYDQVVWSPDGEHFAATGGGFLDVISARGGPPRRLADDSPYLPDWEPLPR